jgi:hypothetical protein
MTRFTSFRDGPKDQTRNLEIIENDFEIPGLHLRCIPE